MPQNLGMDDDNERDLAPRFVDPFVERIRNLRANQQAAQDGLPEPYPEPTPAPQTEENESDTNRGRMADYPLQVVGGIRDAAASTLGAIESAGDWLRNNSSVIKKIDEAVGSVPYSIPEVPAAETMGAGFVRSVSQFIAGFVPGGKVAKALGITGGFTKAMAAGALSDAITRSPDDKTIGNLIEDMVGDAPDDLKGTLMDYITVGKDDTDTEKRLKHTLEGAGLGVLAEGVFMGAKALLGLRQSQAAKEVAEIATRPKNVPAGSAEATAPLTAGAPKPAGTDVPRGTSEIVGTPTITKADDVTQLARQFKANVEKQRRGTRTIAQAVKEANEAFPGGKMGIEDAKALLPGTAMNDNEAVALINTVVESAAKTQQLAGAARSADGAVNEEGWNEFVKQLGSLLQIEPARLGVEAEAGRTLRVLGDPIVGLRNFIKQITEVVERGANGLTKDQVLDAFLKMKSPEEMLQVTRNLAKPGWWDVFTQVRVNGLLSGTKTFVANALGSTGALGENIFERMVAEGTSGGAIAPGEAHAMMTGVWESMGDAWRLAAKSFRGEVPDMTAGNAIKLEARFAREKVLSSVLRDKIGPLGGWVDTLENIVNIPGRILVSTDDFFKAVGFQGELRALARRQAYQTAHGEGHIGADLAARVGELEKTILLNPDASMKEAAENFAAYTTFNSAVHGNTAEAIAAFTRTPVGQFIVPFSRTPQNIFKFALERTPGAFLLPSVRQAIKNGGVEAALAKARIGTGSSIMMVFGGLTYGGMITGGGPSDTELRNTLRGTGWQPYSVKIGKNWVSYSRLEPLGSIIGMAADFTELSGELGDDQKDSLAVGIVASVYKNLGSKTFLRGMADAVDAIADPDRRLFDAAQNAIASMVPFSSAIRTVTSAIDPSVKEMHGVLDAARFGVGLEARRDLFGNKILLPPGLGASLLGPLAGMFIPFAVTTEKGSAAAEMLTRIGYQSTPMRRELAGVTLTNEQFERYQILAGRNMSKALGELAQTPEFWRKDPEVQRVEVGNVVRQQRQQAQEDLVNEFSDFRNKRNQVEREREMPTPSNQPDDKLRDLMKRLGEESRGGLHIAQ